MKTILFPLLFICSISYSQNAINQEHTHSIGFVYDYFWIQANHYQFDEYKNIYKTAWGMNYSRRIKKLGFDVIILYSKDLLNPYGGYIENPPGSGNYFLPTGEPVDNDLLTLSFKANYFVNVKELFSLYGNIGIGSDFWYNRPKSDIIQTSISGYGGAGCRVQFLKYFSLSAQAYYKHILFSTKEDVTILFKNSHGIQVKLNYVFNES